MTLEDLITGIIYVVFDDAHGTTPFAWIPDNIDEKLKILAGLKSISLLTAEEGHVPKSLVIVPFQSYRKKAILKFFKWDDIKRRGKIGRSSITVVFNEDNDVVFYKYIEDLNAVFEEFTPKIIKLELSRSKPQAYLVLMKNLHSKLVQILKELRNKELALRKFLTEKKKSEDNRKPTYVFKLVVCGDAGVGKSSLILRYTTNAFSRSYLPTLGVNISEKRFETSDYNVQFSIWDIAGQDRFFLMRRQFYQGADSAILVFDLSRASTFMSLPTSYNDIKTNLGGSESITGFVVGNKNDLKERIVSREEAIGFARSINFGYIETSALTGNNVQEAFKKIVENLMKSRK
ncbi:MAG: GTP-binding protein [Candidatus Lokiarchaeota archaeon]|nr:GTP-binding protein [Candidatus Lokiarchaeota archaeon]